jgi:hypothetical protein
MRVLSNLRELEESLADWERYQRYPLQDIKKDRDKRNMVLHAMLVKRSLKPAGRTFIQCAGRGRDDEIFTLARLIIKSDKWSGYFRDYFNPHGIYGPEEYHDWLAQASLEELKASVTVRDLLMPGRDGLEGFIRTI